MWEEHDISMKKYLQQYKRLNKYTQNQIQSLLDTFDINKDNLFNTASTKNKKKINIYIEVWKEKSFYKGAFKILVDNIYNNRTVTNNEILELLVYSSYMEEQIQLDEYENQILYNNANYYYKEGQKEVNKTLKKRKPLIDMTEILFLAMLAQPNSLGWTWKQYNELTTRYNANELYRQILINIQQEKELEINSDEFQRIINKQINQKICINDNKISGVFDLEGIGINNLSKIEGIKEVDSYAKVIFLANLDGNETEMCHSLSNQEFYVDRENVFNRYYGETTKALSIQRIKCHGLVLGLNLPPITHHFHWCRSTIQYVLENTQETEYNVFNYLKTKVAKNYKNSLKDFKTIQNDYDMIPQSVKNRLEKENITIVLNPNLNTSGYNPKSKEILLMPNLEEGEFIHEIGHALEDILDIRNNKKYIDATNEIFKNNVMKFKDDKTIPYVGLKDTTKCISDYQTYLGVRQTEANINKRNKFLRELVSESYRAYYYDNSNLKKANNKLYELVEEIEKNA